VHVHSAPQKRRAPDSRRRCLPTQAWAWAVKQLIAALARHGLGAHSPAAAAAMLAFAAVLCVCCFCAMSCACLRHYCRRQKLYRAVETDPFINESDDDEL